MRMAWRTVGVLTVTVATTSAAQWKTPWSYEGPRGPAHWSTLDSAYAACAGSAQSPIDIRSAEKAELSALRFEYTNGPLEYLINNGKTIRVNYHDTANALVVSGVRYHLTQFHFHRPSEDLIDGRSFDMVLHLMHESRDGKLVGVAVQLNAGAPNAIVQKLWDHMPLVEGPEHEVPGVDIDPTGLLPTNLSYYTYEGSLTAPPCTERVTWYVLKAPTTVSPAQISAFAKLYPHNVRAPQPLNGRVVKVVP